MKDVKILSSKNVQGYLSTFTEMVCDMLEDKKFMNMGITKQWIARLLFQNVPNAEALHGLATTVAYKHLVENPSEKNLQETYILGWCLQMYATCYFILDDMFDKSKERHFKPCWYLVDNMGKEALNDVIIMESCVYYLIKKHFETREFYPELVSTLHDLSLKMAMSQTLESKLSKDESLESFTMETYNKLVKYKMCYYPTYIHVKIAMLLAGIRNEELIKETKRIFSKIDFHFQPRDDFLDIYGDNESHEAETGNDIEERRCSWIICKALELATPNQKTLLKENYGKGDFASIETVKNLFVDLGVKEQFEQYENSQYCDILNEIENLNENLPKSLFKDMMWASFPNKISTQLGEGSSNVSLNDVKRLTKNIPDFLGIFPQIIEDLIHDPQTCEDLGELNSSISRLMLYNVPHGKKTRGLTIAFAYKALGNEETEEAVKKSYILGWCLEMLQAAALVADDVMDKSLKRRGLTCWYKLEEVGLSSLNDAIILESSLYRILKKYFSNEEYYLQLLDLFQDNTFKTAYGQSLDILTGTEMNIDTFTMERYTSIVKYKTSYYTFYLPVALSLTMSGVQAKMFLEQTTAFLLDIGHFFQVQDDYLDCFGDYETIGKIGTDIADGKCSWLVVSALEIATQEQREYIKENYGKGLANQEKIDNMKKLYRDLKLPQKYAQYENETYELLQNTIENISFVEDAHKNLFIEILKTTYKRKS